jgi:hypothetical protein
MHDPERSPDRMAARQRGELFGPANEQHIRADHQRVGPRASLGAAFQD